jgi:hypothetical protein
MLIVLLVDCIAKSTALTNCSFVFADVSFDQGSEAFVCIMYCSSSVVDESYAITLIASSDSSI